MSQGTENVTASPAGVPPIIVRRLDPERDPDRCAWYLRCTNTATLDVEHPTLGTVPACVRCLEAVGIPVEVTA